MENKFNIPSIPKEKLEFVGTGTVIRDQKFEDKPIGYFKDAWLRFCKNKASIVAACIILAIILFAVIVPFFNFTGTGTNFEQRYAKKVPRNLFLTNLGIATGDVVKDGRASNLINFAALGIAANPDISQHDKTSISDAINSDDPLQPVTNIIKAEEVKQGKNKNTIYYFNVDNYLEVGFVYLQVSASEYEKLVAWQDETGIQLLYPLIANNEYNLSTTSASLSQNANWWYKTNNKGAPVTTSEMVYNAATGKEEAKALNLTNLDKVTLEENYMRDSEGNLVYRTEIGAAGASTEYRVRVLFYNYYRYTHDGAEPEYIFGTDVNGYDLAYRMAVGLRLSLLLSVCIFVINFILGAMYGSIEGYYGGTTDLVMEFIAYVLSGVPFMVVATLFQIHLAAKAGPIPSLLFAFVVTGWIGTASLVRTQFYRFKNQEYVMAARTLGARDQRIIWKHIFPNTLGTIITSSVLAIPGVIFSESMLSYLGIVNLGSSTSTSLGTLLSDASGIFYETPHLMVFPALVISLLMICFNLFGNGLRDAFNPSLRGSED